MKKLTSIILTFLILCSVSAIAVSAAKGDIFLPDGKTQKNYVGVYKTETINFDNYSLTLTHPVYLTIGEDINDTTIQYLTGNVRPGYIVSFDSGWTSLRVLLKGKVTELTPEKISFSGSKDYSFSYIADENKDNLKKAGTKTVQTVIRTDSGSGAGDLTPILRYNISVITKEEADEILKTVEKEKTESSPDEVKASPDEPTTSVQTDSGKNYDSSNNANGAIATGDSSLANTVLFTVIILTAAVALLSKYRKEKKK